MTSTLSLTPHPRLYISKQHIDRLALPADSDVIRHAQADTAEAADEYARSATFPYPSPTHNEHLIRARIAQGRIVTLLVQYFRTGKPRFKKAALDHARAILGWEFWSWIKWRENISDPMAIFDLSYGENSATLAIVFDLLHEELSESQRSELADGALRRAIQPFLRHTETAADRKPAWWHGHAMCNWNTVCNGGAAMLALAMAELFPKEAATVVERAESGLAPYWKTINDFHGGWPEGIGYWNYGMRYGFMYLLSHERATGKRHPMLDTEGSRRTLEFPLDFAPRGAQCGFGDANHWSPLPFHLAAAERYGMNELSTTLLRQWPTGNTRRSHWPMSAELLLFRPQPSDMPAGSARTSALTAATSRGKSKTQPAPKPIARLYDGLGWAILADQWPQPNFYLSLRGGSNEIGHAHRDLFSFQLAAGGEHLISNINEGEYLDTTFSPRRWELYEMTGASKNAVLINGVGVMQKRTVAIAPLPGAIPGARRAQGFRMTGAKAYSPDTGADIATHASRTIHLIDGTQALIVDVIDVPHDSRIEARFHTRAKLAITGDDTAVIRGKKASLSLQFAASVPCVLRTAVSATTTPRGAEASMVRWCTQSLHSRFVLATLISTNAPAQRGKKSAAGSQLKLRVTDGGIVVAIGAGSRALRMRFKRDGAGGE